MEKEIKLLIEKRGMYLLPELNAFGIHKDSVDKLSNDITALFKAKMLEMIGEDKKVEYYEHSCGSYTCCGCKEAGRNYLRAELRKKVEGV